MSQSMNSLGLQESRMRSKRPIELPYADKDSIQLKREKERRELAEAEQADFERFQQRLIKSFQE